MSYCQDVSKILAVLVVTAAGFLISSCAAGPSVVRGSNFPFGVSIEDGEEMDYQRVMANKFDSCTEAGLFGRELVSNAEVIDSVEIDAEAEELGLFSMSQTVMRTESPEVARRLARGFAALHVSCPQPDSDNLSIQREIVGFGIASGAAFLTTAEGQFLDDGPTFKIEYFESMYATDEYLLLVDGTAEPVTGYDYRFFLDLIREEID